MIMLIGRIGEILLIMFIVRAIMGLFTSSSANGGSTQRGAPRSRGGAAQKPSERVGGQLVRDPQCGTYVPESGAITVTRGDDVLHFCSEKCRDAYAAAH